jgi:hypothetical protein
MKKHLIGVSFLVATATAVALIAGAGASIPPPAASISLLLDPAAGPGSRHAFAALRAALRDKRVQFDEPRGVEAADGRIVIVAGSASGTGPAVSLARALQIALPSGREALLIRHANWKGKKLLLVAGADDRGLMYALYDVADRIGWAPGASDPLSEVRDTQEKPAVPERALSMYTMNQAYFESRFYDEAFWARYLDTLARNRFNTFALLFAYESSGYFAPPYPYFFEVEGFPEVRAIGVTREQQQRNLAALNRLIRMTHERGLDFTLGIWDHIYRGGHYTPAVWDHLFKIENDPVQRPMQGLTEQNLPQNKPGQWPVQGLTEQNLLAYSQAAIAKLLRLVPNIQAIQFRMHGESGLGKGERRAFWSAIYRVMKEVGAGIRFDARAKDLPDDIIDLALEMGVPIRICTKYWAEQMGLPFHPTHIQRKNQFDRRHGYADMLRYPQRYKMHWRLWTGGTSRILLWGDPDYVRRFAESTHLYDGDGFEVNEPLATKMASHPHNMPPFELLRPQYRYYDWEFERYWHFFQVFGRLGYNPETPAEVWDREFERRFGKDSGPYVERALHQASRILPRIVAYSMPPPFFPTTRGWPEKQRWENLPAYAAAEPSDTEQFVSIQEEARNRLLGKDSAKTKPEATSQWFASLAKEVKEQVQQAEKRVGGRRNKEFDSTVVDLKILASLAEYHARRIPAGISYALFQQSQDLNALEDAIAGEGRAIKAWEEVVQAAGDVYNDNLAFGRKHVDHAGHWRNELEALRNGLSELERQKAEFRPQHRQLVGKYDFGSGPLEEGYQRVPRRSSFTVELPSGHYRLLLTVEDDTRASNIYGPMWIEANGVERTDVFTVKAGERVERTLDTEVRDGKLHVLFGDTSMGQWHISKMTVTRIEPLIAHVPVRRIRPDENFVIRATISGEDAIRAVRVGLEGAGGYRYRNMERSGPYQYQLRLSAGEWKQICLPVSATTGRNVRQHSGLNYFLEAVDEKGRRSSYPAEGREHPVAVAVSGDLEPPVVTHRAVTTARPGEPLRITAEAKDPSGVRWVRVRYRSVNQHQDYYTLPLVPAGAKDQYQGEIPGKHIPARWDLMYFIEVMDNAGNGRIYPELEKETPYVVVKLDRSR